MGLNETELNFGTVGSSSHKEAYFALINNNPVAVLLKSWGTNMTGALVELMGVEEGNHSSVTQRHSFTNMSTTVSVCVFLNFILASSKSDENSVSLWETFNTYRI